MVLNDILSPIIIFLPLFAGYGVYALQKKAKILDDIVGRLYKIEQRLAVIDTMLSHMVTDIKEKDK